MSINSLDMSETMMSTILAAVAEEESRSKSFSLITRWPVESRLAKDSFLSPALLGYYKDENGHLIIKRLTEHGKKTKLGNDAWNPTSIAESIENERHCGDVFAHKTYRT